MEDKINKPDLFKNLKTKQIGRNLFHFDSIDSTNIKAKELAKDNCPHGTIVVAEEQISGNGRFKRLWNSPLGGLWFTLVLRPKIPTSESPKITQIAAASIYKTFKNFNIDSKIKWPNDLIINDKKICGILLESRISSHMEGLILGIGININNESFSSNLNATSLYLETNKKEDIKSILFEVLESILLHIDNLKSGKSDHINIINEYNYLYLKNAYAVINDKKVLVKVLNILDNNHLQVQYNNDIIEVSTDEISFHKD